MAIRRIGQVLVDLGFISDDQLEMLLEEQGRQPGEKLGRIAEEMGLITDEQIAQALAEHQLGRVRVDRGVAGAGLGDDGAAVSCYSGPTRG